jgi:hypothetical protein
MKRLNSTHVTQAQRFLQPVETFDPLRPAEERSEAEEERHAEFAWDAHEDTRMEAAEDA